MSTTIKPDKRLNAYRDDLANVELEGRVSAGRFVEGKKALIVPNFADVHAQPSGTSGLQTQFLHGHDVTVFETQDGWAWIQGNVDGYVGYVRQDSLQMALPDGDEPMTHMISAPRTFLYSEPDMKCSRSGYRSIGSKVEVVDTVTTRGTDYAILDSGDALVSGHLLALGDWYSDPVGVAETLLHTPYLWGGTSGFGIDCSGLISLAYFLCGRTVLRDSDMQANSIGEEIAPDTDLLRRGDLVFWKAHAGMMADGKNLLHANGHSMDVRFEPLADAIQRIGYLYGSPTCIRRP
jgi:cell wall-associated NlpC family hydrolase